MQNMFNPPKKNTKKKTLEKEMKKTKTTQDIDS